MSTQQNADANGSKKPTIAVDFDGVLYTGPWEGSAAPLYPEKIMKGAKEAMEILSQKFRLIIFSARSYTGKTVFGDTDVGRPDKIEALLREHSIPFDEVVTFPGKISADIYLDDKAVCFTGDWFATVTALETFQPWWKRTNAS
jgi:hypothetical protein